MQELKQPILFRAFPEPNTKTRTKGDMGQTSKSIECTNVTAAISTGDLHGFLHHVSVEQIHLCHVGLMAINIKYPLIETCKVQA